MSTTHPVETYTNIVHEAEVDGGWSGQLRIVVGTGTSDQELVFVDSDLLGPRRLVLTAPETLAFSEALQAAAAEVVPPYLWDREAFPERVRATGAGHHSRTLADLNRHIRALSGWRQRERSTTRRRHGRLPPSRPR